MSSITSEAQWHHLGHAKKMENPIQPGRGLYFDTLHPRTMAGMAVVLDEIPQTASVKLREDSTHPRMIGERFGRGDRTARMPFNRLGIVR